MRNSHHNKNTYPQEISASNEGTSKMDKKPNFHQNELVLPQELIDPSLRFNQVPMTGATHKKEFSTFEKSQISFPSNFENIDPRILIQGIIGENKSSYNMENIDPRLVKGQLDLTRIIENPTGGNGQNQESNQQNALPPEDKSSGETHNNFDIEKEINSRLKKLSSIRNNATNECLKNTIHSPIILEKHLSEAEYEKEAGLFRQMEIQEEAEDEKKFILTEEEYPGEGYKNWQPLKNANLEDYNKNNSRNNYECANQHVKWLEDISKPKKNKIRENNI
ncbi:hypothetical protein O181_081115 [Austropuccinia psidii MF-1]|uniref:Uncharacterized protein n=1 Tax=Austropuccinia psidii MF-1 TaxID=1389203 RepID=A0A9Q3FPG6_9BASI|nr:hypothetical protein [Austropuccinia psidii MF-1]